MGKILALVVSGLAAITPPKPKGFMSKEEESEKMEMWRRQLPKPEILQSIGWIPCPSPEVGRGNIAWRLSGEALASANPPIVMDDETKRVLSALLALGVFTTITAVFPLGGLAPVALFAKAIYGGTYFISF